MVLRNPLQVWVIKIISGLIAFSFVIPCLQAAGGQGRLEHAAAWQQVVAVERTRAGYLNPEEPERIHRALLALAAEWPGLPKQKEGPTSFRPPRYVWKLSNAAGQVRQVMFTYDDNLHTVPCSLEADVAVLDDQNNLLSSSEILLTYGHFVCSLNAAALVSSTPAGIPMIKLTVTGNPFNGGAHETPNTQYYALAGDSIVLVRLEVNGMAVREPFASGWFLGPPIPDRTPEQWESALRSKDTAEVLATLTWMGGNLGSLGTDINSSVKPSEEVIEDAKLAQQVYVRKGVREVLGRLKLSDNPWVKEAANLASESIY